MKILKVCLRLFFLLGIHSGAMANVNDACQAIAEGNLLPLQNCEICDKIPTLAKIDEMTFEIDLDSLKDGGYQFSVNIQDAEKTGKSFPELASLDFLNFMSTKKGSKSQANMVWSTKNAYLLDVAPDFFTDEIINDPDYNAAINKDTVWKKTDQPHVLTYTKSGLSEGGKSADDQSATSTTYTYDVKNKKGSMTEEQVAAILNLNPELKVKPAKIVLSFSQGSSDKRNVGSVTVTKYYQTKDNKTLLVSYWLLGLNLGFLEKGGLSVAGPIIKSKASPTTKENVELARLAVKKFSKAANK